MCVPTLGLEGGGEGGPPDGRQGPWSRGAFLARVCVHRGMCVNKDQDLAAVCVSPSILACQLRVAGSTPTHVYVYKEGRGQA